MYVCLCNGVSSRTIEQLLDAGARSVGEIQRKCSAGGDCGSCHRAIHDMVERRTREGGPAVEGAAD